MFSVAQRIDELKKAFRYDGFTVADSKVRVMDGTNSIGMVAEHTTAKNLATGQPKKAYYVEGSPRELGYLIGFLAKEDVHKISYDYTRNFVKAYLNFFPDWLFKDAIVDLLIDYLYDHTKKYFDNLPKFMRDEINGIVEGYDHAPGIMGNPANDTANEDLFKYLLVLNLGVDVLCGMVYKFEFFELEFKAKLGEHFELKPEHYRIPAMCNAFSVFGDPAGKGHYFGRDFMFSTAGIFQDTAAMIIYNPGPTGGEGGAYPFVSMACPGMIGSIAAMNTRKLGIGVDMCPGSNSNPFKFDGVNSLLMNRLVIEKSGDIDEAEGLIKNTPRSVSWFYFLADGEKDRACVVEAGVTKDSDKPNFLGDVSDCIKDNLPETVKTRIEKGNYSVPFENGVMVRRNDYRDIDDYMNVNGQMWDIYNKHVKWLWDPDIKYDKAYFAEDGYIDQKPTDSNCPSSIYFAPQREKSKELLILTNHYLIPEMRFYSMDWWIRCLIGHKNDDIQWRYDELNREIRDSLANGKTIDFETAKKLIDFLSPTGKNSHYYDSNPVDNGHKRIEGSTSIFDLKNLMVESHYGHYDEEWVRITLAKYVNI